MIDLLTEKCPAIDSIILQRKHDAYGGSGFILGTHGSGVSQMSKQQIISVLQNTEDDIVVIDTNGSYRDFARCMDGEVFRVGVDKNAHVDPFAIHIDDTGSDYALARKTNFLVSFCETVMASALSPEEKQIIKKCVTRAYQSYLESKNDETGEYDKEKIPTMQTFHELIREYPGVDPRLVGIFERYASSAFDMIAQRPDPNYDKRLVVYDMCACVGDDSPILPLLTLEHIWTSWVRGTNTPGKHKWLFVDDVYPLLKATSSVQYLHQFCKVGNKYNCVFTGVTRHPVVFAENQSDLILLNCSFLQVLRLSQSDKDLIGPILCLSTDQMYFIEHAAVSQSLVLLDGKVIVLQSPQTEQESLVFDRDANAAHQKPDHLAGAKSKKDLNMRKTKNPEKEIIAKPRLSPHFSAALLGISAVAVIGIMKRLFPESEVMRYVAIGISGFLIGRAWRQADMLNKPVDTESWEPVKTPEEAAIDFLTGTGKNDSGNSLADIWAYSDRQLEQDHSFIQWMFPLDTASEFNVTAPVVTEDDVRRLDDDTLSAVRSNMIRSLSVMLNFYGFTIEDSEEGVKIIRKDFANKKHNWCVFHNHNQLRITRIIKSLKMFDLDQYAKAFYHALIEAELDERDVICSEHPIVNATTLKFWAEAATDNSSREEEE